MLANYIQYEQKELQFDVPGVSVKQADDTATLEYILNMIPDQRKELGIHKSTRWYIQKNLREGKKVKLYDKVRAKMTDMY
jgi:CRISPR-associated protein Cas1